MASKRILEQKENTVKEITDKISNSKTFLLLNYQGLTVSEIAELRSSLREVNSDIKVYKNTLMNLALKNKNIELNDYMSGPNAYLFADSIIEPISMEKKLQILKANSSPNEGNKNIETSAEKSDSNAKKHFKIWEYCYRILKRFMKSE